MTKKPSDLLIIHQLGFKQQGYSGTTVTFNVKVLKKMVFQTISIFSGVNDKNSLEEKSNSEMFDNNLLSGFKFCCFRNMAEALREHNNNYTGTNGTLWQTYSLWMMLDLGKAGYFFFTFYIGRYTYTVKTQTYIQVKFLSSHRWGRRGIPKTFKIHHQLMHIPNNNSYDIHQLFMITAKNTTQIVGN